MRPQRPDQDLERETNEASALDRSAPTAGDREEEKLVVLVGPRYDGPENKHKVVQLSGCGLALLLGIGVVVVILTGLLLCTLGSDRECGGDVWRAILFTVGILGLPITLWMANHLSAEKIEKLGNLLEQIGSTLGALVDKLRTWRH